MSNRNLINAMSKALYTAELTLQMHFKKHIEKTIDELVKDFSEEIPESILKQIKEVYERGIIVHSATLTEVHNTLSVVFVFSPENLPDEMVEVKYQTNLFTREYLIYKEMYQGDVMGCLLFEDNDVAFIKSKKEVVVEEDFDSMLFSGHGCTELSNTDLLSVIFYYTRNHIHFLDQWVLTNFIKKSREFEFLQKNLEDIQEKVQFVMYNVDFDFVEVNLKGIKNPLYCV